MSPQLAPGDFLTAKELGARLGVCAETLLRLRRAGKLPAVKMGRAVRFYRPEVILILTRALADAEAEDRIRERRRYARRRQGA